ncbi:uncharacterized protein [Lepeophtheirus salmonis]|nr:uncharacterized protein LOC121115661 isoform X2 [Lepeophtheirus salmonis]
MHTNYPKISARERDLTPRYYYKRTRSYTCCQKLQNWIRKVIAFLFTQVGVCVLIGIYMIIGAFIFRSLELGSRKELAERAKATRTKFAFYLWNLTLDTNTIYSRIWVARAEILIKDFQNDVVKSVKAGYTGTDVGVEVWTFSAALMYSMTVFTTIGYGNLTPKTDVGKIATIFYALIGIPLMLLYMNNIGHILGTSFKYTYSKFCRCSKPSPHDYVGKGPLPSSLVEVSSLGGDDKTSKRSSSRSKVSNSSTTNATLTSISPDDEIENEFPDVIIRIQENEGMAQGHPSEESFGKGSKKKKRKLPNPLKNNKSSSPKAMGGNTVEFKLVEDIRLVTVPVTSCILVLIGRLHHIWSCVILGLGGLGLHGWSLFLFHFSYDNRFWRLCSRK